MGVRTRSRIAPPRPVVQPKPIDIHDDGYKGKHPDDVKYPHSIVVNNPAYPGQRVEVKAFSKNRLEELIDLASDYLFPLLAENGLKVGTLAEKRSGGGKFGSRTLGACFSPRHNPTFGDERQAIILDQPSTDPRVLYTLIHECGHLKEMNHGPEFKRVFGEMLDWAITEGTPYTANERDQLVGYAKGDSYAPPVPVRKSWDDYAAPRTPASPSVAA
jgi:hypothetical protein